jgi:hypothetical protein
LSNRLPAARFSEAFADKLGHRPCYRFDLLEKALLEAPMKFIHQREHLNEDDIVVIQCSQTCNIRLMSDANFRSFKNGGRHSYHGGAFDTFPARITAPSTGFWNITIDTVTSRAISVTRKPTLTHSIKIVRRSSSKFS